MKTMKDMIIEHLEEFKEKGDTFLHIFNFVSKQLKADWKVKYHGVMTIPELEGKKKAEIFSMLCTQKEFVNLSREKSSKIEKWALSKYLTYNEIQNINSYELNNVSSTGRGSSDI